MIEIIYASNNPHKLSETQAIVKNKIKLLPYTQFIPKIEVEETGNTFEENAFLKADAIFQKTNKIVLSEDSGLVIPSLNGNPGIKSARYAGDTATDEQNIQKVLSEAKNGCEAYFKCVLCLLQETKDKKLYFHGKLLGQITTFVKQKNGFGYDPIFIPIGQSKTLSEINTEEKNNISHRKIALDKMTRYILNLSN